MRKDLLTLLGIVLIWAAGITLADQARVDDKHLEMQQRGVLRQQLVENNQKIDELEFLSDTHQDQLLLALQLKSYGLQQHLAALGGAYLESEAENSSFLDERIDDVGLGQVTINAYILATEIAGLESTIVFHREQLESLMVKKKSESAALRSLEEELINAPEARSSNSKLLELSNAKIDALNVNAAAINSRLKWLSMQLENRKKALVLVNNKIATARKNSPSTTIDYQENISKLEAKKQALYQEQSALNLELESVLAQFIAREELKEGNDADHARDLLTLSLKNNVMISSVVSDQKFLLGLEKAFWTSKATLHTNNRRERSEVMKDLSSWLNAMSQIDERLDSELRWVRSKIDEWSLDPGPQAKSMVDLWMHREQRYLTAQREFMRVRVLFESEQAQNLRESSLPLLSHLLVIKETIKDALHSFWGFEITSIEVAEYVNGQTINVHRGVTVAKVVKAILFLVAGFLIAVQLSKLIFWVVSRFTRIKEENLKIARKWFLVIVFVIALICSMLVVHIPLAVFAFMGGAIAIGLGFGTQTLLKNLISGFFVQIERRFRVGDIIEINGMQGEIIEVGVRATVLRTTRGIEVIVPNSTFMEMHFTNWTLMNPHIRFEVNVVVAYGSDVHLIKTILAKETDLHEGILKDPEPEIMLGNFGENGLEFVVQFWVDVNDSAARTISSDLRVMIEKSLREANIVIACPQREVRLNVHQSTLVDANVVQ